MCAKQSKVSDAASSHGAGKMHQGKHTTTAAVRCHQEGMTRRRFLLLSSGVMVSTLAAAPVRRARASEGDAAGVILDPVSAGEDLFSFIERSRGAFDQTLYRQIIGAANEFKEGDAIVGVAAGDQASRERARQLLLNTRAGQIDAHPLFADPLYDTMNTVLDPAAREQVAGMSLGQLKELLLQQPEDKIRPLLPGISSDLAACLVKTMSNGELIALGHKLCVPLPGSRIGAPGYLGARIQPNSPTDHPDDILWQVLCGFSYAVGDVVLGTNPVSSETDSVARLERTLWEIRQTFGIAELIPHSVLAHIDIQARVEQAEPGKTGIWFQSLAGSTAVNNVFDISLEKMISHAEQRRGRFGLYFETGQGADFTSGHSQGTDMVIHESRKYGYARYLKSIVAAAQQRAGYEVAPWLHVNDVAGFIGPEVFRTREQLVRCCLEDIAMARLQGITIGLDVCTTLHMDISLDDLDWALDEVMPAAPAYLMALPTKMDPMLGYMTTSFQDHVRLREKFGRKVNDPMWAFFRRLGVIDAAGAPGPAFGQPLLLWLAWNRARGDSRPESEILAEGRSKMAEVRQRGVPLAEGHGINRWDLAPELDREIRAVYAESKKCIWAELPADFVAALPGAITLESTSADRADYILHPQTGEILSTASLQTLQKLLGERKAPAAIQIVISDGLNSLAISDEGHLTPFLETLREELSGMGLETAAELLVVKYGRVRAGYRIGEALFGHELPATAHRAIVHIIGERPGSMNHTFSAYITAPPNRIWKNAGQTDHNITRVVSGIGVGALDPRQAAVLAAKIIRELIENELLYSL